MTKDELFVLYPGTYRQVWAVGLGAGLLITLLAIAVGLTAQSLLQGRG